MCYRNRNALLLLLAFSLLLFLCGCQTMRDFADAAGDATNDAFGVPTQGEVDEIGNRPDRVGGGIGWGEGGGMSLAAIWLLHLWRNFTRRKALRVQAESEPSA